jgi:hypothetical protein
MKTSLALFVAATSICVFTQAADAQSRYLQTTSYYAPVPTTAYYPSTTAYYAPTVAYYPTSAYYAPTTAYYGGSGYYGSGYYRGYNRGGLFGTGLFGWAGVRGIDRRWDRRGW